MCPSGYDYPVLLLEDFCFGTSELVGHTRILVLFYDDKKDDLYKMRVMTNDKEFLTHWTILWEPT